MYAMSKSLNLHVYCLFLGHTVIIQCVQTDKQTDLCDLCLAKR
jgi:hypothetical protein